MRFGAYLGRKRKAGIQPGNQTNGDSYARARDRVEALIAECKLMSLGDSELIQANLEKLLAALNASGDATSRDIAQIIIHPSQST